MWSYRVRSDDQKLESLNNFLTALREYVDADTGIRVFSISRFARRVFGTYAEASWAIDTLKRLGLLDNLGSAGKKGGTWRVDISERMVKPEDLHSSRVDINSNTQQSLVRQLKAERGKVARLNFELAKRDTTISNLEDELASLRETIQDELITSLVIIPEEQKGTQ
ncbi:MAG TPA: hypothetical protein PJ993_03535 [Candidatus Saccharibacteria bacterium]|nr:hypothetical protein [Candidatus Saccharibacteria bacterium]HMT39967.1 hypothetical protein [Candidatus Saccharibacteria bacterium]